MAEVTYYFSDAVSNLWEHSPQYMYDGNTASLAFTDIDGRIESLVANTCPGADLGTITKVELRCCAQGDGDDRIDLQVIGGYKYQVTIPDVLGWSAYVDITDDPRLTEKTWAEIVALDVDVENVSVGKSNRMYCSRVDIRVTYDPYPPDPPTDVIASDGAYYGFVRVDWTKSPGATEYQVYRDGTPLGWVGDVDYFLDEGAGKAVITPGSAVASDGESLDHVSLSVSGESVEDAPTHTYKVRARNIAGESGDSNTDTGYRKTGTINYQWQRSAGDSDADYKDIDYGTTENYIDSGAPPDGSGRYYQCVLGCGGAESQTTASDRGYRIAWTPPEAEIDVGAYPAKREWWFNGGFTVVDKNNPANANGVIHSIKIWARDNITDLIVGTFYLTNGNTLKCRDSENIGAVEAGAERTFTELSISVQQGDYIGCYFTGAFVAIEGDWEGYEGLWAVSGEYIDPNDEADYTFYAGYVLSLYGYGDWTPPVSDIDVGASPIDRDTVHTGSYTLIDKNNPANASGVLHSVKVWADTNITGLRVGTFYVTNGDTLKCRDSENVGDIEAGAERTISGLSIAVQAGDYIGCYWAEFFEDIERSDSGYDGVWYIAGEYIDPDDEATYELLAGNAISLYGYGDIEAPPAGQPYIKRVQGIAGMRTIGVNQSG